MNLADIDEVKNGQTTPVFKRYMAPELARSSFSVIYNRRRSSLDLIAKDHNEFKIWTTGLRKMIEMQRANASDFRALKEVVMPISVTRFRRSTVDLKDAVTGDRADCDENGKQVITAHAHTNGNKQMYKPVSKNLQALKKKLATKRRKLAHKVYYDHELYGQMQGVIRNVQGSVDRITDWFQCGEYHRCDDEIWRAGVDLESLTNMMAAVKGS